MQLTAVRGPFALNITADYTGDPAKAEQAFRSFCGEGSGTEGGSVDGDSDSSN